LRIKIVYIVTVWAYYARYLLNEHSIRDGSDAPQYLVGRVLKKATVRKRYTEKHLRWSTQIAKRFAMVLECGLPNVIEAVSTVKE